MPPDTIEYSRFVEGALRTVVRDALAQVAEHGLPGRHHIYVTFDTQAPGVTLSDTLAVRYPGEMTIVLQHEFWALTVDDDGFGVTLSFNNKPERIVVPFAAVKLFADPSVDFGLQFQGEAEEEGEPAPDAAPTDAGAGSAPVAELPKPERSPAPMGALPKPEGPTSPEDGGADVVPLDQFRKK